MDSVISKQVLNYCCIQQLLSKATKHLHRIFRERWEIYHKLNRRYVTAWIDENEECGEKLVRLCPSAARPMKELMKSAKVDSWDITLSTIAIKSISEKIRKRRGTINAAQDSSIDRVRELRNQIAHGKTEISDDEFEALWYQLKKNLVGLGERAANIEALKRSLMRICQANTPTYQSIREEGRVRYRNEPLLTNENHREESRSGYNYDAPINRYRGNGYDNFDTGAAFDRRRHANEPDYDRRQYAYDRHSPVLQSDYFRDRQYQAAESYTAYSTDNRERRQPVPLIREIMDNPRPRQQQYRPSMLSSPPIRQRNLPSMLPPPPIRQRNLPSMLPPPPIRQRNLPSMLPPPPVRQRNLPSMLPPPLRQPVLSPHSISLRNYMNATGNLLSALRSFTIT